MRKSETLIVTEKFIAERTSRFGLRRWMIWRISDITALHNGPAPVVFYAQTGHDALAMIEAFERPAAALAAGGV